VRRKLKQSEYSPRGEIVWSQKTVRKTVKFAIRDDAPAAPPFGPGQSNTTVTTPFRAGVKPPLNVPRARPPTITEIDRSVVQSRPHSGAVLANFTKRPELIKRRTISNSMTRVPSPFCGPSPTRPIQPFVLLSKEKKQNRGPSKQMGRKFFYSINSRNEHRVLALGPARRSLIPTLAPSFSQQKADGAPGPAVRRISPKLANVLVHTEENLANSRQSKLRMSLRTPLAQRPSQLPRPAAQQIDVAGELSPGTVPSPTLRFSWFAPAFEDFPSAPDSTRINDGIPSFRL